MREGQAREFRVQVPGGDIVGREYGTDGPEAILTHSVGLGEGMWRTTAEALSRTARVVTFTLRGHGRSTAEVGEDRLQAARDVVAIADQLGLNRPAVVGHEFGGAVAAIAAYLAPERFSAVGVVDSPMILPTEEYGDLLGLFRSPQLRAALVERTGLGMSGADRASFEAYLDEYAPRRAEDWMGTSRSVAEVRDFMVADTLVDETGAWQRRPTIVTCADLADLPADGPQPGRELLAELSVPVWIIQPTAGEYSAGMPGLREFARGRDSWQIREVPGTLDLLHRDTVAEELRTLLATR